MSEHTPGPWQVIQCRDCRACNGRGIHVEEPDEFLGFLLGVAACCIEANSK